MGNTNNRVLADSSQTLAATRCLETWCPPADGMERRGGKLRGNHALGLALMVSVAYRMMAVKQTAAPLTPIGCFASWAPQGR